MELFEFFNKTGFSKIICIVQLLNTYLNWIMYNNAKI